jgi:hypothetical protein
MLVVLWTTKDQAKCGLFTLGKGEEFTLNIVITYSTDMAFHDFHHIDIWLVFKLMYIVNEEVVDSLKMKGVLQSAHK